MIVAARVERGGASGEEPRLERYKLAPGVALAPDLVWIDLVEPTREEDLQIEAYLGITVPTREEMKDIEPSNLLYNEDGARFMTARLFSQSESEAAKLASVTFILKGGKLVTLRYDEPRSFAMYAARAARPGNCGPTGDAILAGLIETISDRAAEVLRQVGERVDALSVQVFAGARRRRSKTSDTYRETLGTLGFEGDRVSKVRESLVSIERMLLFLAANASVARTPGDLRSQARTTLRDLQSLEDHASFLNNKIQFLLDATLGLVALEQNDIIKLFSVISVVMMPPTLIASIYGMNFKVIPELEWSSGYPIALALMVTAAAVPYLFFRVKRWL